MNKVYILRKRAAAEGDPIRKIILLRKAREEAAKLARAEYIRKAKPVLRAIMGDY